MDIIRPVKVVTIGRNFSKALANHVVDGFDKRSQQEIDHIMDIYCSGCSFFNGTACTHINCGCNVNREERFLNKLAWASEKCPIGLWGPGHVVVPSGV